MSMNQVVIDQLSSCLQNHNQVYMDWFIFFAGYNMLAYSGFLTLLYRDNSKKYRPAIRRVSQLFLFQNALAVLGSVGSTCSMYNANMMLINNLATGCSIDSHNMSWCRLPFYTFWWLGGALMTMAVLAYFYIWAWLYRHANDNTQKSEEKIADDQPMNPS